MIWKLTRPSTHFQWRDLLLVILLCCLPVLYFSIGGFYSLPFFQVPDADSFIVAQTVLILNGGDFTYNHHPGASVYMVYGGAMKLLGILDQKFQDRIRLENMDGIDKAEEMLSVATQISRLVSLAIIMAFIAIFYGVVFATVGRRSLAVLGTFYPATSFAFLFHLPIIRPEMLSICFMFASVLFVIFAWKNPPQDRLKWVAAGFFAGLAVLAKIQILPLLLLLFIAVFTHSWVSGFDQPAPKRSVILANWRPTLLFGFLIPWWALAPPDFLTVETVSRMSSDYQQVYGNLVPSFFNLALASLTALTLLYILPLPLLRLNPDLSARVLLISRRTGLLAIGGCLSIYAAFSIVSSSWTMYLANTHHLVYSLASALQSGAFLENTNASLGQYLLSIWSYHNQFSRIAYINVIGLLTIVSIFLLFRMLRHKKLDIASILVFAFILAGLLMDTFSSMRYHYMYIQYGVYSVPFYSLALVFFARQVVWKS